MRDEPGPDHLDERLDAPFWADLRTALWRRAPLRRSGLLRSGAVAALLALAAGLVLTAPAPGGVDVAASRCAATAPGGAPPRGTVGFPLRLPDAAVLDVVRAGQRIDVLAPLDPAAGAPARVVAAGLVVLRPARAGSAAVAGGAAGAGPVLYVAARPDQAAALAGIAPDIPISVTVRAP